MLKEAIEEITKLANNHKRVETIGGVEYGVSVTPQGTTFNDLRKAEPEATAVQLGTLSGLVDFVREVAYADKAEGDRNAQGYVRVAGPREVVLEARSLVGRFRQRERLAVASLKHPSFTFGEYHEQQEFLIGLRTLFTDQGDRDKLLALCSKLRAEAVNEGEDDGFSQQVAISKGITAATVVEVSNPVTLHPYRTFHEILQPRGLFVIRFQGDGDAIPEIALFEADCGAWQTEAVNEIKNYLKANLPEGFVVVA